jgi:hypothetical protein
MRRLGLIALSTVAIGAANSAVAADSANPACAAALDLILSIPKHGKHATPMVVAATPDTAIHLKRWPRRPGGVSRPPRPSSTCS